MKRAGLTVIAVIVGTALSGAALAQTAGGGGAAGGGAAGGGASTGVGGAGSVGVPLGPSTPGTAAPSPLNPSTAVGTPTQRTLTGINQNEQLRSSPTTEPRTRSENTLERDGVKPASMFGRTARRTALAGG